MSNVSWVSQKDEVKAFSEWAVWWRSARGGLSEEKRKQEQGRGLEKGEAWRSAVRSIIQGQTNPGERAESSMEKIDQELKSIVGSIVKQEQVGLTDALERAGERLRNCPEVLLEAVRQVGFALRYASKGLRAERGLVLEAVRRHGCALMFAHPDLHADRELVLKAVKQNGYALEHACELLQAEKEVVCEATAQTVHALQYASDALKGDREVVLRAVMKSPAALRYASEDLLAEREVIMQAVSCKGLALRHAGNKHCADREIVLQAVRQDSIALQYASAELQADRELVLEAVKQGGEALAYISDGLRADPEVVLLAVKQSGLALRFASESMRGTYEVVLEAVKQRGPSLRHAGPELRQDKDLMLLAGRRSREDHHLFGELKVAMTDPHFEQALGCAIAVRGEEAPILSVRMTFEIYNSRSGTNNNGINSDDNNNNNINSHCNNDYISNSHNNGNSHSHSSTKEQAPARSRSSFECEVCLLSGASFRCSLPSLVGPWPRRPVEGADGRRAPCPKLHELASKLLEGLERSTEVPHVDRVFLNFLLDDDEEPLPATPWDWDRPLTEFLPTSQRAWAASFFT